MVFNESSKVARGRGNRLPLIFETGVTPCYGNCLGAASSTGRKQLCVAPRHFLPLFLRLKRSHSEYPKATRRRITMQAIGALGRNLSCFYES